MTLQRLLAVPCLVIAAAAARPASAGAAISTDGEALQMLMTSNLGEIKAARLALDKATDPRVREFAATMEREHGDNQTQALRLSTATRAVPRDTAESLALKQDAEAQIEALGLLDDGRVFEVAYVDQQARAHQQTLLILDRKLIPVARAAELRRFLLQTRQAVARHLDHAVSLQAQLASNAP